ncbi:hypothetical protein NADFUDRAFT_82112 [Nadsonia fulvescens var. elongata DSM 6958]|uniref:RRM domain-containing protein n=1 Tax=Nadsonia fulvescens var. elongata DSM 6958 TaxID=857566 RepID=A0A1E3PLZ9_9ASCO|nr:hypothetical protein NADFUDRAFT_82112 [Nadsonia fulvescens var. elongata DSM 6958]
MRARDLAYEFERYGPIIRCDIPPVRNPSARPFAFVEFEDRLDAEDAYYEMHEKRLRSGDVIFVEWAKGTPIKRERSERGGRDDRDRGRRLSIGERGGKYDDFEGRNPGGYRSRSRSPIRDDTKNRDRSRSVSRDRGRSRSRSMSSSRSLSRSRSRTPVRDRSASPVTREHDGPRSRSRSPVEPLERSQSEEDRELAPAPVAPPLVEATDKMEGVDEPENRSRSGSMSVDKE